MTGDLELLTAKEVQAWLRASEPFVRRKVHQGVFRSTHVGHSLRIYRASVVAYLAEQESNYRPRGSRATLGARTAARFRGGR